MSSDKFFFRQAENIDFDKIFELYQRVSKKIGGLARVEPEITASYIQNFMQKSAQNGVQFVISSNNNEAIIGDIHCYRPEAGVFGHIFSDLTIAIDPDYQGKGLGKLLFQTLLDYIVQNRKDILRVELIARESNIKAIKMYENLGFSTEGRLERRIKNSDGTFEADMPMAWFNPNFNKESK